MTKPIVGIDLGTTNSCVAVLEGDEPTVLPNEEGSRTTPSVVGFPEDGEGDPFVGEQAKRQAIVSPRHTIYDIKRVVGLKADSDVVEKRRKRYPFEITEATNGDAWIQVDDQKFSPEELSGMILSKMRSTAEDYFGQEVTEAVITVPAYFDDAQRSATKNAGKIAGLDVRRIVNEPTAAALAYGYSKGDDADIAVFDLGGGTFDISIMKLRQGVFDVAATAGDNDLGGEDFDNAILEFLLEEFEEETGIDVSDDKMALQRLHEAAEEAKCELSSLSETNINLPFLAVDDDGPQHLSLTLTRSELNDLVYHLVEQLEEPTESALEDADIDPGDLDDVLLVGGMTRMPLVQKKVEEIFDQEPSKELNPDEVVAMGAAVQSGVLQGEVREVVLLEVTPMALGIRTEGDSFSEIIPKNTSIPTQDTKVFTTTEDDQSVVTINVLQGNSDKASENKHLGTFNL
ncbi:MAG: molecular chaperone DnaK, partial [Bradymonadaceae bacterium]